MGLGLGPAASPFCQASPACLQLPQASPACLPLGSGRRCLQQDGATQRGRHKGSRECGKPLGWRGGDSLLCLPRTCCDMLHTHTPPSENSPARQPREHSNTAFLSRPLTANPPGPDSPRRGQDSGRGQIFRYFCPSGVKVLAGRGGMIMPTKTKLVGGGAGSTLCPSSQVDRHAHCSPGNWVPQPTPPEAKAPAEGW